MIKTIIAATLIASIGLTIIYAIYKYFKLRLTHLIISSESFEIHKRHAEIELLPSKHERARELAKLKQRRDELLRKRQKLLNQLKTEFDY